MYLDPIIGKYTDGNCFYDLENNKYIEVKWDRILKKWLKKDETSGKYYDDENWYYYDKENDYFYQLTVDENDNWVIDNPESDYIQIPRVLNTSTAELMLNNGLLEGEPEYYNDEMMNLQQNQYNNPTFSELGYLNRFDPVRRRSPIYNVQRPYNNSFNTNLQINPYDFFETKIEIKLGHLKPIFDEIYKIQNTQKYY